MASNSQVEPVSLSRDEVIKWFKSNPWVLPVFVTALVLLKVMRVSHGDLGTVALILGSDGITGLTTLVLLSAGPWMLLMAFLAASWTLIDLGVSGRRETQAFVVAGVLALLFGLLSVAIVPGTTVALCVGLGLGVAIPLLVAKFIGRRRPEAGTDLAAQGWFSPVALSVIGMVIAAIGFASLDTMWLPAERISVEGESPVAGYVISDDGSRALVLMEVDRTTVAYQSEDLEERQRCEIAQSQFTRLPRGPILPPWPYDRPSAYPDCPS